MAEVDLSLARKGDPEAFERLVTPHLNGLFGFICKRTGAMAEDVYQETLLSAWRAIPGFKEGSPLKTWLYAIAGYKCLDALRRKSRELQHTELDEDLESPGFEENSLRGMDIRQALAALNKEDQSLMYLLYTQGFTQKEAAAVLGIPEGTVKSRLNRLRKALKEKLGGEQDGQRKAKGAAADSKTQLTLPTNA